MAEPNVSLVNRRGTPFSKEITLPNGEKQTLTFYKVKVVNLLKLRRFAQVAANLVSLVMDSSTENDMKRVVEGDVPPTDKDGKPIEASFSRITTDPIPVEVRRYRDNRRTEVLEQCFGMLSDQKELKALSELLFDSMRDNPPAANVQEFVDNVDSPFLMELAMAMLEANKDAFAPFLAKIRALAPANRSENNGAAASNSETPPPPAAM